MSNGFRPDPDAREAVARAWKETLDRRTLEQDRPFEEAGGDSLQLMHLIFLLEHITGRKLPPGAFHGGLRPSEMATLLQQVTHDARPTPSERPHLFLFPGMGGYDPQLARVAIACAKLVQVMQVSYPAWTHLLRAPEFGFDALIQDLVAQIASHRPTRPILLAGYSFGGIAAFATAAELLRKGYAVCFLGLLDSEAMPGAVSRLEALPHRPATAREELHRILAATRRRGGAEELAHAVVRRLKSPRWAPVLRLVACLPRTWLPRNFAIYLYRDLLFWHLARMLPRWAVLAGTLPPLAATTFLFRTEDHDPNVACDLGWSGHCPDLTIIPVPGTHHGMLDPLHLPTVCTEFTRAVSQAIDAGGRASG